jgi:SAM-dependent methyltransferase
MLDLSRFPDRSMTIALERQTVELLDIQSPEQLTPLRSLLADAGFTVPAVCHRLGLESIYDFSSIREGRSVALDLSDRLDLLIRLFMDVELVERKVVHSFMSAEGVRVLDSLGLLRTYAADARLCHATVLLYPTESIWIVSDLNVSPVAPSETPLCTDAVYPAITKNTRHFLSSLPSTPCDRFLELCSGTGIAALLACKYAKHAWAADITERATRFARFNAALNAIENCTAVQGDLYDPLAGRSFDRIVAHPPYMPSLEQKYIFRDGGEDGEGITRRIIAGLPDHLTPGGRFYCTCMLTDRKGARAEERIRGMLGQREGDFDIALLTLQMFQPTDYYLQLALAGRAPLAEVAQRHEIFKRLEVEYLVYCSIVVQRRSEVRPVFTARRQVGLGMGQSDIEWLLRWEAAAAQPTTVQGLIDAQPVVSPHIRFRLAHSMQGGAWVADECVLATTAPFALEARCPPWTATLITRCDGRRTTRDHLHFLKESGAVPSDAPESEFVKLIRGLIAGGFMEVADFPRPEGTSDSPGSA